MVVQSLDKRNNPFGMVQGVLKTKDIAEERVNALSYTQIDVHITDHGDL